MYVQRFKVCQTRDHDGIVRALSRGLPDHDAVTLRLRGYTADPVQPFAQECRLIAAGLHLHRE